MAGEPPRRDLIEALSVGLEGHLAVLEEEYFLPGSQIVDPEVAGSTFKMVEAYYGGGKTHYLRAVEQVALRNNFATAFVSLTKDECPLTRFDLIFFSVARGLSTRQTGDSEGIGAVIRNWVDEIKVSGDEDVNQVVQRQLDGIRDLPMMSLKFAFRVAAMSHLSGDNELFECAVNYLTSGKVTPELRRRNVVEIINAKNGSLALRTLSSLLRKLGYAGFVMIMDEGDRSLSIVSNRDREAASNHLVQLINETAEQRWAGTVFLYSIPSYESFRSAFQSNQALISRTETTGFPGIPPSVRIELEEASEDARLQFCLQLSSRLNLLFDAAHPGKLDVAGINGGAELLANEVLEREMESTYRRIFIQSYLKALYRIEKPSDLTRELAREIVFGDSN